MAARIDYYLEPKEKNQQRLIRFQLLSPCLALLLYINGEKYQENGGAVPESYYSQ